MSLVSGPGPSPPITISNVPEAQELRVAVNMESVAVQRWMKSRSGRALRMDRVARPPKAKRGRSSGGGSNATTAAVGGGASRSRRRKQPSGSQTPAVAAPPILPGVVRIGRKKLTASRAGKPRFVPGFAPGARLNVVAMRCFRPERKAAIAAAFQRDGFVLLRGILDPACIAAAAAAVRSVVARVDLPPVAAEAEWGKPLGQTVLDIATRNIVTGSEGNAKGAADAWHALSRDPALERIFAAPELFAAAGDYLVQDNEEEMAQRRKRLKGEPVVVVPPPPKQPPPPSPPRSASAATAAPSAAPSAPSPSFSSSSSSSSSSLPPLRTRVHALLEGRFVRVKSPGAAIEAHADWFHWWRHRKMYAEEGMRCGPMVPPPPTTQVSAPPPPPPPPFEEMVQVKLLRDADYPDVDPDDSEDEGGSPLQRFLTVWVPLGPWTDEDAPAEAAPAAEAIVTSSTAAASQQKQNSQQAKAKANQCERFGPLACLRGSHSLPVVTKSMIARKLDGRQLPGALRKAKDSARLEWAIASALKPGDVVIYDTRTVHADCSNNSSSGTHLALDCRFIVD